MTIGLLAAWIYVLLIGPDASHAAAERPNVLFIAVDDLRPALGCYGDAAAITPNIDRLAGRGIVFRRAYCQEAVCCPSRLSLLSGRRPDTIRVWDLATHFRQTLPDLVTLPQHFKNHGYHTRSLGKIYHGNGKPSTDPPSWSEEPLYDQGREPTLRYALPENLAGTGLKRAASESADVSDNTYVDGLVCDEAVEALAGLKARSEPFFLAVGFRKPHLPFCAPKKYWDLHDRADIPRPESTEHPDGAPELAVRSWKELEGYTDIPDDARISPKKIQELRHGYYACVSYIDALVGRLLDELNRLDLDDNTVILLWGDHGFHLGEQGLWTKANNFELATRAPLILSLPNQSNRGATTDALVEFVDIYPTLVEVCGLNPAEGLEGISMKPLVDDPSLAWKKAVFSQYPRNRESNRHRGHGQIMGYAVRTDRYRYVRWQDWETKQTVAQELYDHQTDPNEMFNLADRPEHAPTVRRLNQTLDDGWKSAVPLHANGTDQRPNILLIVSEDNGPELGCYGEPHVRTPVLDKLAADGVRFERAYVPQAGCSQSRAAYLTGLYPHQNGQIGLATWKCRMYREETPNVVRSLGRAGYRTGIIGKLHVNPESAFPFDFVRTHDANFGRRKLHQYAEHAGEFFTQSDEPFFLSINYPDAHRPFIRQAAGLPVEPLEAEDVTPLAYMGLDSPGLRESTANYYNCMSRLDSQIGELLRTLEKSGKRENTLIVYFGDHGADLFRGKRTSYEGGVRVPLIVEWPGRLKSGQVRDELVSTLDLVPTLLEAAHAERIENLPGRSLVPLLEGANVAWRKYLFTEFHLHSNHNYFPQRTVRNERYKLIRNLMPDAVNPGYDFTIDKHFEREAFEATLDRASVKVRQAYARMKRPPEYELYDLDEDPLEFSNLADDAGRREVFDELKDRLHAWRQSSGDPFLDPKNVYRLKAEIDATADGDTYRKPDAWEYPEYLAPDASPHPSR